MQQNSSKITLPGAIIIAGALIALSIIWIKQPQRVSPSDTNMPKIGEINMRPVSANDHIYGNPAAPIKIVEYSDTSCPYCKTFNPIMVQIMTTYGSSGKVAWVYRHFPLDKADANGNVLHKNSGHEAQALECAASVGGNNKFWDYEKRLYELTPSVTSQTPEGLDQKKLPQIAKDIGIDVVAFNECLASGQWKTKVENDYIDGLNAGVTGTPFAIMITPTGNRIPIEGAVPFNTLKSSIDTLLSSTN